ncbi:MAG: hypothetical protein DME65_12520 [Verrucomicrobia bacterium]|nr:MAG: hypothetical protein DME65_12520 [Verrucomicrobiota bacterium]
MHFALGNVVGRLRKARRANKRKASESETEDNKGNAGSNEWKCELLRVCNARVVNLDSVADLRPPRILL